MSVTASWLALHEQDKEAALETLGLVEVGDCDDCLSSDYACADLPNGWFVVVANDRRFEVTKSLKAVSAGRSALGGWMSETVMVSQLYSYENGVQAWSVVHDPEVDLNGAQVEGVPPSAYAEIKARLMVKTEAGDEDVDWLFDLPPELSVAVCGFRPDSASPCEWTQLQRKGAASKTRAKSKTSLRAEMKKELIPFMLDRGWKEQTIFASDSPGNGFDFYRSSGGYYFRARFDYSNSPNPYIGPSIAIEDRGGPKGRFIGAAYPHEKIHHIPFWKRLLGLERPPPPPPVPDDPIADEIAKAKATIADMETFISTGELSDKIRFSFSRFAKSWPEKHDTPQA